MNEGMKEYIKQTAEDCLKKLEEGRRAFENRQQQ